MLIQKKNYVKNKNHWRVDLKFSWQNTLLIQQKYGFCVLTVSKFNYINHLSI